MVYKIEVVERDVRIAIDENKTSEQLISDEDIDTLSLNDIIRSKIVEAVRRVESSAPVHYLGKVTFLAMPSTGRVTEAVGPCCPMISCVL